MASAEPKPKPKKSKWLDSWNDPLARAKCWSSCLRLVDLKGDGDHQMVVGNMDKKLKVFKGMALASEHVLLDRPVSMCAFYTDENSVRRPTSRLCLCSAARPLRARRPLHPTTAALPLAA